VAGSRILLLISAMVEGGAERVAASLCSHWAQQGHEVVLMPTFSGRGSCGYPLDPCVRIEYLADKVGTTRKTTLTGIRRLLALRRFMREFNPHVVVSFLSNVNIAAVLAGFGTGIPIIVSERSYPPRDKLRGVMRPLRRLCYGLAKCVVAQTRHTAQWISKNCPGAHAVVIPNPVSWPLTDSEPRLVPASVIATDRRVLLAAGRLSPEKGFDDLVTAFAMIASDYPLWDLVIVGEGPERGRLEALRTNLGLSYRIFLPGRAGNMTEWYERADIATLTSHYEGFPNMLIEAMAAGTPVVAMDCLTGPGDIVRHGEDGLLVPLESGISGLVQGFKILMDDDKLRLRMGLCAVNVRQRFALTRVSNLWGNVMELAHDR
jgi:glycosyltransferase involved in cell wall biosynthesis